MHKHKHKHEHSAAQQEERRCPFSDAAFRIRHVAFGKALSDPIISESAFRTLFPPFHPFSIITSTTTNTACTDYHIWSLRASCRVPPPIDNILNSKSKGDRTHSSLPPVTISGCYSRLSQLGLDGCVAMQVSSIDTSQNRSQPSSTGTADMASTPSSGSPRPKRHEVEIFAHALRTRLQFASYKALNGVGKASFSDLASSHSPSTTSVQPLTTSFASNAIIQPEASAPSPASTPALSQGESLPSSSQSSARSTRSIYLDIFGTDFRSTSSSSKTLSRATSFASTSTPSKHPAPSSTTSTRSLLDKAASSPQLGSPERKNGRFDWHNNPTPAMVAHEAKLAAEESFVLPTGSPSKRRRDASHNPSSASNPLLSTPRRARMQSSGGGFLPNGHKASSLAQDLGLTTPRTPRSRHASGRHVFALQPQLTAPEQDQAERDRVATTLAALAETRNAHAASSGSDSSSSSDRPHTPPPPAGSQGAGLGIGFASPSLRRDSSSALAQPSIKRHKRNVSWDILPNDLQGERTKPEAVAADEQKGEGGEDRAAADYLLFLASSPSPSSIKRFSSDPEAVGVNGILSTPAQTSLWDPFNTTSETLSSSGGRRSRLQSNTGARHASLERTPLTPPPSARKAAREAERGRGGGGGMVGLGFDAETLSSSSPASSSCSPSPAPAGGGGAATSSRGFKPAANAEEYILQRRARARARTRSRSRSPSPHTPPPSTHLPSSSSRTSFGRFDSTFLPTTPPNAPGAPGGDTTFSYADFVNVSPSPQPPSAGRFTSSAYLGHAHRTPTKSNRFRFDPRHS